MAAARWLDRDALRIHYCARAFDDARNDSLDDIRSHGWLRGCLATVVVCSLAALVPSGPTTRANKKARARTNSISGRSSIDYFPRMGARVRGL